MHGEIYADFSFASVSRDLLVIYANSPRLSRSLPFLRMSLPLSRLSHQISQVILNIELFCPLVEIWPIYSQKKKKNWLYTVVSTVSVAIFLYFITD